MHCFSILEIMSRDNFVIGIYKICNSYHREAHDGQSDYGFWECKRVCKMVSSYKCNHRANITGKVHVFFTCSARNWMPLTTFHNKTALVYVESIKTTFMEDVSTRVLEKIKIIKKVKPKIIWCVKTYIIAYVKTQKKIRFIIHYVKPTAQLLRNGWIPSDITTSPGHIVR